MDLEVNGGLWTFRSRMQMGGGADIVLESRNVSNPRSYDRAFLLAL